MIRVQIGVSDEAVVVSLNQGAWRVRDENALALMDQKGRSMIVAVGELPDTADIPGLPGEIRIVKAFDATDLDPEISAAATAFWAWKALSLGRKRSWLGMFDRPQVDLMWSCWADLAPDGRRRYLNRVAASMDLTVNGRPAVASSRIGRILGRRKITDVT